MITAPIAGMSFAYYVLTCLSSLVTGSSQVVPLLIPSLGRFHKPKGTALSFSSRRAPTSSDTPPRHDLLLRRPACCQFVFAFNYINFHISAVSAHSIGNMTIDFYYTPGSSPCRNVLLAAKAIGVDLNLKLLDLMKGEHLAPDFVKINPQHCVPTLVDDGFVLLESRAMMTYLASKYGKDDSLYPNDPQKRAVVDQRLYFDMGTLYQRFGELYYPIIFGGAPYDEEKAKKLDEAFQFLDGYLGKTEWAAGSNLTVADIALAASVSTAESCEWDVNKYPNVAKWFAKCKTTIPGYAEANQVGADKFKGMYLAAKNK